MTALEVQAAADKFRAEADKLGLQYKALQAEADAFLSVAQAFPVVGAYATTAKAVVDEVGVAVPVLVKIIDLADDAIDQIIPG